MRLPGSLKWKGLYVIPILAILIALGILIYSMATPKAGERFTEFYILGPGGQAVDYPEKLMVGVEAEVIVGIINREQEAMTYRVAVVKEGVEINELGPITLEHNDRFERRIGFTLDKPGASQKVEFLLYKQGQSQVYKSLYLPVDVTG
jgi:uncharacterized membrane protein